MLRLLEDNSGLWGACVRHNSPSLAVFTALCGCAESSPTVILLLQID